MKPSNKREREAVAIQPTLKPLTEKQKLIGYRKAFWPAGTQYMSGKCYCRECGHEWERVTHMWKEDETDRDVKMLKSIGIKKPKARVKHVLKGWGQYETATCPNCRQRLRMYPCSGKKHAADQGYFSVLECVGKYQIIRTFEVTKYWYKGEPVKYYLNGEVSQRYVDMEKGDVAADIAKPMNTLMGMRSELLIWRHDQPMTPKSRYTSSYGYAGYGSDRYDFSCEYIVRSLHPILKRGKYQRLPSARAQYMAALKDPHAATLVEANQLELFKLYAVHGGEHYWEQMKLCIRHGYRVMDSSMWKDTVEMLIRLGRDTHSPHYICPDNLKQLHDQLERQIRRREEERRRREEIEDLQKHKRAAANYEKFIEPFLAITIASRGLTIFPLPNVEAFMEEGLAMHHCVYSMGYYRKRDTIILSCRGGKSMKRLATIEYALESGTILQCRAACNAVPERDADIRALITKNRDKFIKAIKKQVAV